MSKALVIVDLQIDFCPGGALPVPEGDKIVPVVNEYIKIFLSRGYKIILSRDWHPAESSHFKPYGGLWPIHCVQGTKGAEFYPDLKIPEDAIIISKGTSIDEDAYSAFDGKTSEGKKLIEILKELNIEEIFVCGLATDYCVKSTVLDGIKNLVKVYVLLDGIKGVDVNPGDSEKAITEMREYGAIFLTLKDLK